MCGDTEAHRAVSGAPDARSALHGLKVVEFAQLIAGPLAGTLLADLGAEVIHVEAPGTGDGARVMGPHKNGTHLWWKVSARNNRSVTLDLRKPEGQAIARKLVAWSDVVITNIRTDTLKSWGLDWDSLHATKPDLIVLQVSGLGATRSEPGFGKVGEARSGVAHLTGFPDGPPIFAGFSHADSATGLMGAFGILAALYRKAQDSDFRGEWIDLALFETLFRLIEWQLIVADQLGYVPQRAGNRLAVAPAAVVNTFQTADHEWIVVTSGTVKSVQHIADLLGLPPGDYRDSAAQAAHRDIIDQALREWIAVRSTDDCLDAFHEAEIVSSRIFNAADILSDPIYAEREDVLSIPDYELGPVAMPGIVPRLIKHAGAVWRSAPALGDDNELVYLNWLRIPEDDYRRLSARGVI